MRKMFAIIAALALLYFASIPDDLATDQIAIRVVISIAVFAVSTVLAQRKRVHRLPSKCALTQKIHVYSIGIKG